MSLQKIAFESLMYGMPLAAQTAFMSLPHSLREAVRGGHAMLGMDPEECVYIVMAENPTRPLWRYDAKDDNWYEIAATPACP